MRPAAKLSHNETMTALEPQVLRPEGTRALGFDYGRIGEGFPDMR